MADIDNVDRNIKILIIDDHAVTRELIRTILRSAGFVDIAHAENGMEAMRRISQEAFDFIICDWNMPHCTGLDLLKMVRENHRTASMPFLMLTAEAYRESVKAAIEAGVTDYMSKPFTADTLLAKVGKAAKRIVVKK